MDEMDAMNAAKSFFTFLDTAYLPQSYVYLLFSAYLKIKFA